MGAAAALKFAQVCEHVETGLAIELLVAAQGLDLRRPLRTTAPLEAVHAVIRRRVPAMFTDRVIATDIVAIKQLMRDGSLLAAARSAIS